jgi:hypothetical protein
MTTSTPVQSAASYVPVLAYASLGAESVSRDHKVEPPPRLPSHPNLTGEQEAEDYTVYLPKKESTGPTYSNLNPAKQRKAG